MNQPNNLGFTTCAILKSFLFVAAGAMISSCTGKIFQSTNEGKSNQQGSPIPRPAPAPTPTPPPTPTPNGGVCGSANNQCISGTLEDIADTNTDYLWKCNGTATAYCTLKIPPPNEVVDPNCVQVFYDKTNDDVMLGRSYALMIINLLGHFPEHQPILGPIELYKKGDLERCVASFYVGLTKDNTLPADFINDYKTTTKQMIWLGYNISQLDTEFEKTFGYKTFEYTTLDKTHLTPDPENKPTFFRDILYKGETWKKYNEWIDATHKDLDGSFELVKLTGKTTSVATVLGEAKHSYTGEIIPWALQNANKFYIAEVPLSYFHEGDRYFPFTDMMFDFLKEQPKHNAKNAYIRLEDIGPGTDLPHLKEAMDILKKLNVTPHVNIYPIFKDPLNAYELGYTEKRMENDRPFSDAIVKYKNEGANYIWHGITHQYSDIKNPFTGASGDDYEFWNSVTQSPIAEDSITYVLNKFEDGFKSFMTIDLSPKIWVTPHYEESALDNVMTGQMFPWMVSRSVYIDNKIAGLPDRSPAIYFDTKNAAASNAARRDFFKNLVVTPNPIIRFGQIFPYEIWGDIFRQRIIPENLGNVEPALSNQVQFVRTVDALLADAKRNLVLRDAWAAMFYHPFLLDPKDNPANKDASKPKDLERLVSGIQAMGYTFISLNNYVDTHMYDAISKPRIELEDIRK